MTLSRSPGVLLLKGLFLTMQAVLLMAFVSDDAGVGRSAPLHPLGDGVRAGCDPLALSRGCAFEGFVFDEAGYPFEDVVSDDAGVGRSALLHPLGDGVREGCAPLALSRGLFF